MVRHPKKRHHGVRLRSLFLWHRYFGLAAALFVLILATTGLLLNHSEDMRLDRRHVQSAWLLDWYGISAPTIRVSYEVNGHWVSETGGYIYWNEGVLEGLQPPLRGAVAFQNGVVVATAHTLWWLTPEGKGIAKLGSLDGLPSGIESIGLHNGVVALHTAQGDYLGDRELLTWTPGAALAAMQWAAPATPPADLLDRLARAQRSEGLTLERVMLDLHSGRLFGRYGVYVMDGAALLMVLLAITGVWHWAQRKRR